MSVACLSAEDINPELKKARVDIQPILSFSDKDKIGAIQPYDDTLEITLRIGGYDEKRVMVDQGNGAKIMYPDLYKGLNLRPEDLTAYDSPLVSFDGKVVIPKCQIKLPAQAGSEVMEVDFIVVDAYYPYMAIVARPWLHALGAVFSTLHQNVKYPSSGQIRDIIGAQLPPLEKEELIEFLKRNVDVSVWSAYEALGVDPSFIYYNLNVNPSVTPKKQPPRRSSKDHSDAVRDGMKKLK
ncbi:uncharacterized protein LOC112003241 [Quercus suber]|uniref:uncharacterized protein LOC112003241 n=1 Tax=Quercus suber TaxID=58331 RepID=UPI000CE1DE97|nr:uncharacterized protein LOC112003241 [Quercus suber]